jgi:DNA-binding transcriptional MerR regulator
MSGWTARELARLTDVPVPTVSAWINAGLITPRRYGRGRGGHQIGMSGLLELLTIIELREAGFSLQSIRKAVENLRLISGENRPLARLTLLVIGKDIVWKDGNELDNMPISTLHKLGQRVMVFPIGEKREEFLEQLLETSRTRGKANHKLEKVRE